VDSWRDVHWPPPKAQVPKLLDESKRDGTRVEDRLFQLAVDPIE
jgi:hypothetical protein